MPSRDGRAVDYGKTSWLDLFRDLPHPCSDTDCVVTAPSDHGMTQKEADAYAAEVLERRAQNGEPET